MHKKIILGTLSVFAVAASLFFNFTISAEKNAAGNTGAQPLGAATPLFVEDFAYPEGSLLTNNGWTAHSAGGTNPITVSSPGLTLTGYPSSGVGNSVAMTVNGEDDNHTFPVQTTGTVYAAFMVNVSDASTDPAGGYFFHLGPDPISTTFRGRVFIKKDASNNIAFGISKTSTSEITFTPFSYSLNTTYLLIVKYTIVDGDANDTVSLIVTTTVPVTEPAATVAATDTTASDIAPGSVALRQGSAATSPTVRVDGIRVGTTYASVTQTGGTPTPTPDANVDFDGDGKSDWVVTRPVGGLAEWYISINGSGTFIGAQWGLSTDRRIPADYDGDGKDDIAVWRPITTGQPSGNAYFYILQSSNNTVRVEDFGQLGDDPRVVADYDGDGADDIAVYRQNAGGQNFFYYRASSNNPSGATTFVPWGAGEFVRPHRGDFDGDDRADFCVTDQAGIFSVLRSSDSQVEYIDWGIGNESLIPGDFDGDGRDDFCVVRGEGSNLVWYILLRTGSTRVVTWGLTGDRFAPGDYDGDGRQDVAIWRPSTGTFYVLNSGNSSLTAFQWGQTGDDPEANWYVHTGGTP